MDIRRSYTLGEWQFESGSIGLLGAAVGVVVAFAGVRALLGLAPPDLVLPETVPVDLRILGFAASLVVTAGLGLTLSRNWIQGQVQPTIVQKTEAPPIEMTTVDSRPIASSMAATSPR